MHFKMFRFVITYCFLITVLFGSGRSFSDVFSANTGVNTNHITGSYKLDAVCPIYSTNCTFVHPYYATKFYQCFVDTDCLPGYKCCLDCNYVHRVCKALVLKVQIDDEQVDAESSNCPEDPKLCKFTFPISYTQHMQCHSDKHCAADNICCRDSCYEHKICKETSLNKALPLEPNDTIYASSEEDHTAVSPKKRKHMICPPDPNHCEEPYSLDKTLQYKCKYEEDCVDHNMCCTDSCFHHKICKLALITEPIPSKEQQGQCPRTSNQDCKVVNSKYYKYKQFQCVKDSDCLNGYKCCEEACIDFKVCKFPNNAFAHKRRFQGPAVVTTTAPPSEEAPSACPPLDDKCRYPFSLRLFRLIQCQRTEDCFADEICCPDSCSDFKICKSKSSAGGPATPAPVTVETPATVAPVSKPEVGVGPPVNRFYIVDIIDEDSPPDAVDVSTAMNGVYSDDEDVIVVQGSGSGSGFGSGEDLYREDAEVDKDDGSGLGANYPSKSAEDHLQTPPHVTNNIVVIHTNQESGEEESYDEDSDFEFTEIAEVTEDPLEYEGVDFGRW